MLKFCLKMGSLKTGFIVLNIMAVSLVLVYITTYVDRTIPALACKRGKTHAMKNVYNFFGQKYNRYLVYLCDQPNRCGEWPDRVEGMVMAYLLAKMTKRKFGILSTSPVRLEKLVEPILVDWIFDETKVVQGTCAVYDFLSHHTFFQELKTANLDEDFQEDIVFVQIKKFSLLSLMSNPLYESKVRRIGRSAAEGFYNLYHDILRLNKRMLYQFLVYKNQFKEDMTKNLTCAVVESEGDHVTKSDMEALWKFVDKFKTDTNTKIAISSQDNTLLDHAIIRYTDHFMSIPGLVSRFDTGDDLRYRILDNLRQIILDFYTLLQCNTLVITCGNPLGYIVAFTRHPKDGLYYLHSGSVYPVTLQSLSYDFETGECSGPKTN